MALYNSSYIGAQIDAKLAFINQDVSDVASPTFVDVTADGLLLNDLDVSTVVVTDGSKNLDSSTVTVTELNLLSGLTGTIWTSNNDGAASTLDADLLDGQEGSYYLDWGNLANIPADVSGIDQGIATTDDVVFNSVDAGGSCESDAYTVGGVSGVDFSGAVTNITVVKGIVTAAS